MHNWLEVSGLVLVFSAGLSLTATACPQEAVENGQPSLLRTIPTPSQHFMPRTRCYGAHFPQPSALILLR